MLFCILYTIAQMRLLRLPIYGLLFGALRQVLCLGVCFLEVGLLRQWHFLFVLEIRMKLLKHHTPS